ncbi:hypothetical protein, partial [Bradyrhizobium sp. NBAIM08]|uniref:hypothetical protein n=1 Tax=Bradyrhizobium sp. NBAIM08 TaxID=2793815 RepID=UPI001CD3B963
LIHEHRVDPSSALVKTWYLQPFNIAMYIIAGLAAQYLYAIVSIPGSPLFAMWSILGAMLAAVIFVELNNFLIGFALILCRGVSLRDSGILDVDYILPDLINLCIGYVVALLWGLNPLLIVAAILPL